MKVKCKSFLYQHFAHTFVRDTIFQKGSSAYKIYRTFTAVSQLVKAISVADSNFGIVKTHVTAAGQSRSGFRLMAAGLLRKTLPDCDIL